MTTHSVINRRDLDFLLFEWLPLKELFLAPRFAAHDSEGIAEVLSLAQRLAEQKIAPTLRASDTTEPFLQDGQVHVLPEVRSAVLDIAASGLCGAVFDEDAGGLQLPHVVYIAAMGLLMSGTIGTASFMLLTVANARLIMAHGTLVQKEIFAKPQIAGRALGTMCLSEPHAGSSLADIRTRALPDGDDLYGRRFRLFGQKMWISAADHDVTEQIVHLVLAKVPEPGEKILSGTRAISLFIVPKVLPDGTANDVEVVGLNHKMGYRAIPNCALNFGESGYQPAGASGAVGWLIGEVGHGLSHMFYMMNEARIAVGLGAAMLAYRGYLLSLEYARHRVQGRKVDGASVVIAEYTDVKRMLLAQKSYAEGALALVLFSSILIDQQSESLDAATQQTAGDLLALLTPVSKTWPSEWAQCSLDFALQIHGGAGYSRDFEVEQLYRDNRLNPIHEGTTGIQAIDLVSRKLRKQRARGVSALLDRVTATTTCSRALPNFESQASALESTWATIGTVVTKLCEEPSDEVAVAHATSFLFAFGHAIVGWLWLDQAVACSTVLQSSPLNAAEKNFRLGKLRACRYFSEHELPKVQAWLAPILTSSNVTSSILIEEFLGEAE